MVQTHSRPTPGIDYIGVATAVHCLNKKGEILLIRRSAQARDEHGAWDKIGGGAKHGETIREVALREVKEETNADAVNLKYLGFQELFREHEGKKTHWIIMIFSCEIDPAQVVVNIPEADEHGWFKLDALPSPLHSQFMHQLEYLTRSRSEGLTVQHKKDTVF